MTIFTWKLLREKWKLISSTKYFAKLSKVIGLRAVSREIPTGNSREFPEKSCSRKFPGIISGSREFSGIFYVLRRGNVLNFIILQMFFFWFRSSFTVEKNTIHAEHHWNSSMNCIFLRIGVFLSFYKVSFKVSGNSREFPDWFREIPVPGNGNLSGNRPPYMDYDSSKERRSLKTFEFSRQNQPMILDEI